MKRYIAYLGYLFMHKYYVFMACIQLRVPLVQAIMHDVSKFYLSEFFAYADCFYDEQGNSQYNKTEESDVSWLKHQRRNPHHWQYWVLISDDGETRVKKMPKNYVMEMIADWSGTGMAIAGERNPNKWYENNKEKMMFHEETRIFLEQSLVKFE